jgi:hypothetical protein
MHKGSVRLRAARAARRRVLQVTLRAAPRTRQRYMNIQMKIKPKTEVDCGGNGGRQRGGVITRVLFVYSTPSKA